MAVMNRPKPTRHQNTVRQVATESTAPPTTGAIMGARALTAMRIDITEASRSPWARSTSTARPTTAATPPPKPCRNRPATSTPMPGARAHTTAPRVHSTPPTIMGARRPRRSETVPPMTCPSPMPTKKAVSVRPTAVALVARSAATWGKAGLYMSVAKGGTAFCAASATMSPAETAAPVVSWLLSVRRRCGGVEDPISGPRWARRRPCARRRRR